MPVRLFGHTCAKCGADHTKASAWAEKDGKYYCHRRPCLREAGVPSAQFKRQRQEQPPVLLLLSASDRRVECWLK